MGSKSGARRASSGVIRIYKFAQDYLELSCHKNLKTIRLNSRKSTQRNSLKDRVPLQCIKAGGVMTPGTAR